MLNYETLKKDLLVLNHILEESFSNDPKRFGKTPSSCTVTQYTIINKAPDAETQITETFHHNLRQVVGNIANGYLSFFMEEKDSSFKAKRTKFNKIRKIDSSKKSLDTSFNELIGSTSKGSLNRAMLLLWLCSNGQIESDITTPHMVSELTHIYSMEDFIPELLNHTEIALQKGNNSLFQLHVNQSIYKCISNIVGDTTSYDVKQILKNNSGQITDKANSLATYYKDISTRYQSNISRASSRKRNSSKPGNCPFH